ncbi:glycosyltransferase family A protein [Thioalkalicoccus limnaeus]|uniref:Glycosyltransferase family A protein n=1 Tax=Thioalkalicoccus limnaeus TaxID=120681 RepID=A0ABV4BDU6_9GAMM
MTASVIIPVKNGGPLFREVLARVMAQRAPWRYECLVIDSGSTDGSVEAARRQAGVRVHQIAPAEFGHGRTRNLGCRLTSGDFIVFLTQDALPGDERWLDHLVSAAARWDDAAGAFGRHVAYPDARIVTHRELEAHFAGFGSEVTRARIDDAERFRADPGYRQVLHFFSNNNACIRRDVWQRLPFPEIDFAEDQAWALKAVEAGYSKVYAPHAWVYHSHDFGLLETSRRAFDEARALRRLFGYDLVPTWRHLLRDWRLGSRRDLAWVRAAPAPWTRRVAQGLYAPWLVLAKLLGRYLGTHHGRFGAWTRRLSRDEALRRR